MKKAISYFLFILGVYWILSGAVHICLSALGGDVGGGDADLHLISGIVNIILAIGAVKLGHYLKVARGARRGHYPSWLSHLQSASNRVMYATLPLLSLLSFAVLLEEGMREQIGATIAGFLLLAAGTYALLTTVHLAISEYKPWRERSKSFRMYWFLSGFWAIGVIVFVGLFEPYGYRSWNNHLHMLSVVLAPLALVGIAMYTYQRYMK